MTRDSLFALKVIDLSLVPGDKVEQLKNEVEILKRLDHKNIIRGRRKVRC
jgi:serine/threonine protein kinase